jgi:regulator of sigma E protease
MLSAILIVIFVIIGLLILHELGHFLMAKKFGVRVEEFGIFLPPRIFGKKIGETIYSFNLLPFGAFVKITGEEERVESPRSFSQKPLWQRALIILGGVVSFWIIGFFIFTLLAGIWGLPISVDDEFNLRDFRKGVEVVEGPEVQIVGIAPNSPAERAGLQIGDTLKKFSISNSQFPINKIKEIQELTQKYKGKEIMLTIQRGKEVLEVSLVPRVSPPENEGPIGISLARIVKLKYLWFRAPLQGALVTSQQTIQIPLLLGKAISGIVKGEKVKGLKFVGPIGIGNIMVHALEIGFDNFLMLVAVISIWLALFNLFPIPALDGGKLLFLTIEGIRKKPVSQELERTITTFFFFALILLMIFVTLKDIKNLF